MPCLEWPEPHHPAVRWWLGGSFGSGKTTAAHMLSKFANPDKAPLGGRHRPEDGVWPCVARQVGGGHPGRVALPAHRRQHCAGRRHPDWARMRRGGSGARVGVCRSVARRVGRQSGGQRRQAQRRASVSVGVGGRCTETPMSCCWTRPRPPWTQVQVDGSASAGTSGERKTVVVIAHRMSTIGKPTPLRCSRVAKWWSKEHTTS